MLARQISHCVGDVVNEEENEWTISEAPIRTPRRNPPYSPEIHMHASLRLITPFAESGRNSIPPLAMTLSRGSSVKLAVSSLVFDQRLDRRDECKAKE
ncbi:predicted protein [Sclerotinia sclerotiorum 1980 UF-70]|uniref:Uncharacterized protein n=1 Tax=Sclerotinia sclerotiorum (strain ATCC 18683 / 1980 / Ss-1) TaxID=665079 RepID=A7ED69_SCLS1|nr:predicted protein [Sclerotinia sclerotiorum 1980 UF-70]EDO00785.1 predicted protein [Sclerotinia sclerotiorum 1980 UF-70]